MISTEKLYNRLKTLTVTGTSGYFTAADFNSNLYSVQYSVLALLCDNYENNQKVSDALINHVKEYSATSQSTGKLFATSIDAVLTDYYRALSLNYTPSSNVYPSKKIAINEVGMYLTSPIRKPDIATFRTLYSFGGDNIQVYPKSALPMTLTYCRKPDEARIVFTTAEDEDNDYLVINQAQTIDIDFPEGLFNLFVYLMLESMGIEQKEQLAMSYAQLGITRSVETDIN